MKYKPTFMSHYITNRQIEIKEAISSPGSSPKMFEKALNSNADYIFLDLEDAVSPNDKIDARKNVITAIKN